MTMTKRAATSSSEMLSLPSCEHDWQHEMITDVERCTLCDSTRLASAEPFSDVVRSVYDAATLARIDRALAAAAARLADR